MAILSSDVVAGTDATAAQYNNLRADLLTGDVTLAGVKTFSSKPIFSVGITISNDSSIAATKKLYLDGGGNTYIVESAGDVISFYALGILSLSLNSNGALIPATKKLYLDGGGDSYITESGANILDFYTNGSIALQLSATLVAIGSRDFRIEATKKLYLDSGVNTYILESGADIMDFYTGASIALRLDASQNARFYGTVRIPDNTALEFGSVGDYIKHNFTGDIFEFFLDGGRVGYVDATGFHNG